MEAAGLWTSSFWATRTWSAPDDRLVKLRLQHGDYDPRSQVQLGPERHPTEFLIALLMTGIVPRQGTWLGTVVSRFSTPEMQEKNWCWTLVLWNVEPPGIRGLLSWFMDESYLTKV